VFLAIRRRPETPLLDGGFSAADTYVHSGFFRRRWPIPPLLAWPSARASGALGVPFGEPPGRRVLAPAKWKTRGQISLRNLRDRSGGAGAAESAMKRSRISIGCA